MALDTYFGVYTNLFNFGVAKQVREKVAAEELLTWASEEALRAELGGAVGTLHMVLR